MHTHHVLSQIAGSPLLAEEQAHSEHSEETAHPHETTGDSVIVSIPSLHVLDHSYSHHFHPQLTRIRPQLVIVSIPSLHVLDHS